MVHHCYPKHLVRLSFENENIIVNKEIAFDGENCRRRIIIFV
jgi:hypothetical protein